MREEPSLPLLAMLGRLGLSANEVRAVRGRARRLARGVPLFDTVWVNALAQARVLTAFQAAEINAGRSARLLVGPYVLVRPLRAPATPMFLQPANCKHAATRGC